MYKYKVLLNIINGMVNTVADFLEEFKAKSLELIKQKDKDITHRPTIGNIYEGLTAEILNRAIFKDFDLRIVLNSFIYNDSEKLSDEMDCMIVCGKGKQISFTNQYKYHIKDVIAVIQVKKKLSQEDMSESHKNLMNVIETAEPRDGELYMRTIQRDAYRGIVGKELPFEDELENLPDKEKIMYHFLQLQAFWPLRISLSYYGYETEFGFREGFVKNIEKQIENQKLSGNQVKGYNPVSFPDLIISGNNTIIKNIGMPFGIPWASQSFYWLLFSSWHSKPSYFLLELIWTRLSYKFGISSQIFGDDYQSDPIHPLLWAKDKKMNSETWAWEYYYHLINRADLKLNIDPEPWMPIEINNAEQIIIMKIMNQGSQELNEELEIFLSEKEYSTQKLVNHLTSARVVYVENNKLFLLLDIPVLQMDSSDRIFIGENKNGEMMHWLFNRPAS